MLRSLLLAAALGLPTLGLAQPAPRYYLGTSVSVLTDNLFHSGSYHNSTPVGAAITGGLVLGPRTALQVSPSLLWSNNQHTDDSYYYNYGGGSSSPISHRTEWRTQTFALPALLRYTFTNPGRRLRFGGLGGFTLLHSTTFSTYTSLTGSFVLSKSEDNTSSTLVSASLGPALCYGLLPWLELVASAPINFVLNRGSGGFNDRLVLNILGGVHYTFGAR